MNARKQKDILTEAYSVQIDKRLLREAREKINLPEAVRALVDKVTKSKVCPCCGGVLPRKEK